MKPISLSKRLITTVLSIYVVLTIFITSVQVISEYYITKAQIEDELKTLQKTFSASLTRAIWELNEQQYISTSQGLIAMPSIKGVILRGENETVLMQLGQSIQSGDVAITSSEQKVKFKTNDEQLFGFVYPLIFEFSGKLLQIGDLTLLSSQDVIIERIRVPLYLLIAKAILISLFLYIIISRTFKRLLTQPLYEFTEQIENFGIDKLSKSKIQLNVSDNNELIVLQNAYNSLLERISDYSEALEIAHQDTIEANNKLDDQNLMLEQEVAKKTANLSRVMMDLEKQKHQLEESRNELKSGIEIKNKAESALLNKQSELEQSLFELKSAQTQLIESEKMASLGGLVAGIAHDVNTPIGVSITAVSYLIEQTNKLKQTYDDKKLTPQLLESLMSGVNESAHLIQNNLKRASDLVASFKQISVDQASDAVRDIELKRYMHEIISSLKPNLKKSKHTLTVNTPDNIHMRCPAGAISQIITNLIMNSLLHGFEHKPMGEIIINITEPSADMVQIEYSDNGRGVSKETLTRLFDLFFTTKRSKGGSGLGTHIVLNLVKQTLRGQIVAESELDKGLKYTITIPKITPID